MSTQTSLRIPDDLASAIAGEVTLTGKTRSQIIVERLRESFGLSSSLPGKLAELEARVKRLEAGTR